MPTASGLRTGTRGCRKAIQKTSAEKVTDKIYNSARCDAKKQGPELGLEKAA